MDQQLDSSEIRRTTGEEHTSSQLLADSGKIISKNRCGNILKIHASLMKY
jgi:hypothetical protein